MSLVVMTKRGRGIRELHSAGGEKGGQILPDNMFHYHNFLFSPELAASFRLAADYSIFPTPKCLITNVTPRSVNSNSPP
jgi:hypothetical protein